MVKHFKGRINLILVNDLSLVENMRVYIPAVNTDNHAVYFEVQSFFSKGTGAVCVTGQVAENVRESVLVAWSMINHFYCNLGDKDIHVHFTEGSFCKEGTSCGLAIVISLLDSLNILKNEHYKVLASGEIDLYGNIYQVGGVRGKTQNLGKNDFDLILFPEQNRGEAVDDSVPIKYLGKIEEFVREYSSEEINILL